MSLGFFFSKFLETTLSGNAAAYTYVLQGCSLSNGIDKWTNFCQHTTADIKITVLFSRFILCEQHVVLLLVQRITLVPSKKRSYLHVAA